MWSLGYLWAPPLVSLLLGGGASISISFIISLRLRLSLLLHLLLTVFNLQRWVFVCRHNAQITALTPEEDQLCSSTARVFIQRLEKHHRIYRLKTSFMLKWLFWSVCPVQTSFSHLWNIGHLKYIAQKSHRRHNRCQWEKKLWCWISDKTG